ncbi:ABC transporter ATP-binding protein [Evansella sp. AB-P1]|uniref:ABC transporter ATP-binding protein n=1 Tax=Evansella sp. AB-P1 TaxID=3037653 RepID=UPI00241F7735|nr:ABC transporter ATP-binding protein [Evansella sp. AB-P1]MDG5788037.1 ABC transporter ATP-binding protein [Evansella sp. AB-P1]
MFTLKEVTYNEILHIKELHIPGEKITCIVGESGSGKSTAVKLLNNLISSDAGSIEYKNKPIHTFDTIDLRREVVMVPQTPIIFDGTVKENLLIGLQFSEKPFVEDEKLHAVLETVHLKKSLEESADQLSGGEKQRLSLGRVLIMEPEVYIFDEPTSALDEATEDRVMGNIIKEIKGNQKTAIIITHSKKVAQTYGDLIVEIKNGQIVETKEISNHG